MEKLPYLKDFLSTNIPVVVSIVKRVGQYPETDFNTKQPTGRMQTLYNFKIESGEHAGIICRHYAKEREEETLGLFSAGESVQVVRQETMKEGRLIHFLVWTPTEGAEARLAANPPVQSNTRQTATQRDLKEREEERELKDISICLQGFAQAFIIKGSDPTAAISQAVIARSLLLKAAKEAHLGIPSLPEPSVDAESLPF